jgi:general secretion pathway protein D
LVPKTATKKKQSGLDEKISGRILGTTCQTALPISVFHGDKTEKSSACAEQASEQSERAQCLLGSSGGDMIGVIGQFKGALGSVMPCRARLMSLMRLKAAFVLIAALGACVDGGNSGFQVNSPRKALVAVRDPATGQEIITTATEGQKINFFSRENLRATSFSGNTNPRLAADTSRDPTGFIDTRGANMVPGGIDSNRGEFYTEVGGRNVVIQPLPPQRVLGGEWQGPLDGGTVQLEFTNEPLTSVVQRVLGGVLGVNYNIGNGLEGAVTFRSEQNFTRRQVVEVLSDILARNGYLMQYFNGVYHIGRPEELQTLTGIRGASSNASEETTVVRLRRAAPDNLADIINSILPAGTTVQLVDNANGVMINGDPEHFDAVEGLIDVVMGDTQLTNLAIIPLRRSPPDVVVEKLTTIYQRRTNELILVPVETVPGILVMASEPALIKEVQALSRQLDVENRDTPKVRLIQLKYLNPSELAAQLNSLVDSGSVGPGPSTPMADDQLSNVVSAAIDRANPRAITPPASDDGEGSIAVPPPTRFVGTTRGQDAAGSGASGGGAGATTQRASAGEGITFSADDRNRALLVRSTFAEFQQVQEVVKALDVPLSQVAIEATIVEVDINDALQFGVQAFLESSGLTVRSSSTGSAAMPAGGGFGGVYRTVTGGDTINAVLSALQSVTNVRVISSPYLTVVDGATSRLSVGDQIPYTVASQTSNSDGTVTVTEETDVRDVGVILSVTPRVSPDNSVLLEITQEVSSARQVDTAAGEDPIIAQRSITSQIIVQSGSSVLLGGLIQERSEDTQNGIPVLRRIPILGQAFNRTQNTQTRSELLVMITPRVARSDGQMDDVTRKLRMAIGAN